MVAGGRIRGRRHFNPRPPRGGRHGLHPRRLWSVGFQSTPSARRATCRSRSSPRSTPHFNPRPPRGERPVHAADTAGSSYFNPRPPRGERLQIMYYQYFSNKFQSTPSARRATSASPSNRISACISIHALREESDRTDTAFRNELQKFQSTPSARRATVIVGYYALRYLISIHALREESDCFR